MEEIVILLILSFKQLLPHITIIKLTGILQVALVNLKQRLLLSEINVIIADLVGDRFSNTYNTIYWNPETGTQNENGTVTSTATDFDHEADHANAAIDGIRAESNEKEESKVIGGQNNKWRKLMVISSQDKLQGIITKEK